MHKKAVLEAKSAKEHINDKNQYLLKKRRELSECQEGSEENPKFRV